MKKIIFALLMIAVAISSSTPYANLSAKEAMDTTRITLDAPMGMQKIKENYRAYATGGVEYNKHTAVKSKIAAIEKKAKAAFDDYTGNTKPEELFKGNSISKADTQDKNNSNNFKTTAQKILEMALGYMTSGTSGYQNATYKANILEALDKFYTVYDKYRAYNVGGSMFGNWWNWEIGVPIQLSYIFALMDDEIHAHRADLIRNYITLMDSNLRNGTNGDVNLNAPQHTGTNLADITINRILQGAASNDEQRIKTAVKNLMTVFDTIDPYNLKHGNTDGVYEDNSFIQHHRVAYTGSYGRLLLQRALQSLVFLDSTPWAPQGQLMTLQNWIYKSFSPVMYEGYMMEMVKGRAVSRTATGYQDGTTVIESMVLLSQRLNGDEKTRMESQVKYVVQSMPKFYSSSLTLSAIIPYETIMKNASIQPESSVPFGGYAFNAMDKNVQIGKGFAFALSRSSNRIAKYEYMLEENLKPWFQGDGAYYLYLSGKDQSKAFGVNYFATMDPFRFPGTTVALEERKTIPELYGQSSFPGFPSGQLQNDYVYFPVGTNQFSGSTVLAGNSIAGLQVGDDNAWAAKQQGVLPNDFVAYKNANANKSWFMFGDKVVVLGSGVGDDQNRKVTTTIDNRMSEQTNIIKAAAGDQNGNTLKLENGVHKDLRWIAYEDTTTDSKIGYYFPENKAITVNNETRSGNLRNVRKANPDKTITSKFFTLSYDHVANNDTYSYVIMPNADESTIASYAKKPDIEVLENTASVHAVKDVKQQLSGYNFFAKGTSNGVSASSPATILMKQEGSMITLAVSDPTFSQNEINIRLASKNAKITAVDKRTQASNDKDGVNIKVNTSKLYGKTVTVKLALSDLPQEVPENKPTLQPQQTIPSISSTSSTTPKQGPTTGDTSNTGLYGISFLFALVIIVIGICRYKKLKNER